MRSDPVCQPPDESEPPAMADAPWTPEQRAELAQDAIAEVCKRFNVTLTVDVSRSRAMEGPALLVDFSIRIVPLGNGGA